MAEASQSRLLYSATMSLDGYIAGAGGDMSWLTPHLAGGPDVDDLVESVGALLVGRRTYGGDDPNAGTDAEGAFGGKWHGAVVVLTHDPPAAAGRRRHLRHRPDDSGRSREGGCGR